jgi:uncharacterized protein DUF6941
MDLDFAILADAVEPAEGGKLNLMGASVDTLWSHSAPFEHPSLTLVSRMLLSTEEVGEVHRLDVALVGPDGEEIVNLDRVTDPVEPPSGDSRRASVGFVTEMKNLPIPSFGRYELVLSWDGRRIHSLELLAIPVPE